MIILTPLLHRKKLCIAIRGLLSKEPDSIIRAFPGRLYSATYQCWYIPYSETGLEELMSALGQVDTVKLDNNDLQELPAKLPEPSQEVALPPLYDETLRKLRYSEHSRKNY